MCSYFSTLIETRETRSKHKITALKNKDILIVSNKYLIHTKLFLSMDFLQSSRATKYDFLNKYFHRGYSAI